MNYHFTASTWRGVWHNSLLLRSSRRADRFTVPQRHSETVLCSSSPHDGSTARGILMNECWSRIDSGLPCSCVMHAALRTSLVRRLLFIISRLACRPVTSWFLHCSRLYLSRRIIMRSLTLNMYGGGVAAPRDQLINILSLIEYSSVSAVYVCQQIRTYPCVEYD